MHHLYFCYNFSFFIFFLSPCLSILLLWPYFTTFKKRQTFLRCYKNKGCSMLRCRSLEPAVSNNGGIHLQWPPAFGNQIWLFRPRALASVSHYVSDTKRQQEIQEDWEQKRSLCTAGELNGTLMPISHKTQKYIGILKMHLTFHARLWVMDKYWGIKDLGLEL